MIAIRTTITPKMIRKYRLIRMMLTIVTTNMASVLLFSKKLCTVAWSKTPISLENLLIRLPESCVSK